MKKGVFHTNGFKPLEEVVRIVARSEPDCDQCPFRRDCGPGCVYKEVRWYLEEYQDMHNENFDDNHRIDALRYALMTRKEYDQISRKENDR